MLYVYERFARPWRHPERVVDESLRLQQPNGLWDGKLPYCIDLDGLYCILRSSRNAGGYRSADALGAVKAFLATACRVLNDREALHAGYRSTHKLTGALSAIAECARFYPELLRTPRPWRQSLDAAPYI